MKFNSCLWQLNMYKKNCLTSAIIFHKNVQAMLAHFLINNSMTHYTNEVTQQSEGFIN